MRHDLYTAALVLIAATGARVSADDLEEIEDAATRVQYAYYTSDVQALQEALNVLAKHEGSQGEPLRSYYLAYGEWRLAQLYGAAIRQGSARSADRTDGQRAARACVGYAQAAIASDKRNAEAHALLAACDGFTAGAMTQCRDKPLRTAGSLAPNNPRVRLVAAMCTKDAENPEVMRAVVTNFESAGARRTGAPDWGHAEALTLLGASLLQRGDALAARDALERALVIAPDYREAQDLLHSAAARP